MDDSICVDTAGSLQASINIADIKQTSAYSLMQVCIIFCVKSVKNLSTQIALVSQQWIN